MEGRTDINDHGLQPGQTGRPNKGIAMSLSLDAIPPTIAARDGATKRRTVLVGYDGSDESRAAVAVAIDRAQPSDRIVLVHATARMIRIRRAGDWRVLGEDVEVRPR